jgi:hypothetical protein
VRARPGRPRKDQVRNQKRKSNIPAPVPPKRRRQAPDRFGCQ